jgi:hypothetical protein
MKRAYEMHDHVKSLRDEKIAGPIIGFGTLFWERKAEGPFDTDDLPVLVYLVQINEKGSSSLGPAVAVLRADQVKGRWEE